MISSRQCLTFLLISTLAFSLTLVIGSEFLIDQGTPIVGAPSTNETRGGGQRVPSLNDVGQGPLRLRVQDREGSSLSNGVSRGAEQDYMDQVDDLSLELLSDSDDEEYINELIASTKNATLQELRGDQLDQIVQAGPELLASILTGRLAKPVIKEGISLGVQLRLPDIDALHEIGLRDGDLLTSIDGMPIAQPNHFIEVLLASVRKDRIRLSISREGEMKQIELFMPRSAVKGEFYLD